MWRSRAAAPVASSERSRVVTASRKLTSRSSRCRSAAAAWAARSARAPGAGGAPLVAEQGERGLGLGEVGVQLDGCREAVLDAVLEAQQSTERLVVGLGRRLAGGEGEAVGVGRAAPGLAVQRAYDGARDVVGLLADLGHRRGLEQVAASQGADGVERHRAREYAEDATVVGGVDAEPGRTGSDQAGAGEAAEQRVGGRWRRPGRCS